MNQFTTGKTRGFESGKSETCSKIQLKSLKINENRKKSLKTLRNHKIIEINKSYKKQPKITKNTKNE